MDQLGSETPFARLIADQLDENGFVLIDIGAAGGVAYGWRCFGHKLRGFGFDPDPAEVARLNAAEHAPGFRYVAGYVGLPPDHPFKVKRGGKPQLRRSPWLRLAIERWLQIQRARNAEMEMPPRLPGSLPSGTDPGQLFLEEDVSAINLAEFLSHHGMKEIDFVKVDVDGADIDIIQSMGGWYQSFGVLGVGVEVNFFGSACETDNTFHNIDRFLRREGFELFDISVRRYPMQDLPAPSQAIGIPYPAATAFGRPLQGDAFYARDVCAAWESKFAESLSVQRLAKSAALFSLFGLPDCAAELLVTFRDQLKSLFDVDDGLELLARQAQPDSSNPLTYAEYISAFERQSYAPGGFYHGARASGVEIAPPQQPVAPSQKSREMPPKGRLRLDLDAAWTPEATVSIKDLLPVDLRTPAAQWAYGLSIPLVPLDGESAVRRARLELNIANIQGRLRIGITSKDGSRFVCSKIVDRHAAGKIVLPVEAYDLDIGALVAQNVSETGSSQLNVRSLELIDYPAERDNNLSRYMRNGFDLAEGWCERSNIAFLRAFDEVLFSNNVDGGICEIGVHHGKQFVALHILARDDTKSIAIDVFGDQEFNLDGSGLGDYETFMANLGQWGASPKNCLALRRDSLSLRTEEVDELIRQLGPVKFFSIDGCHEIEHTIADMRTAMRMTAPGGVIVLDDYLNPDFPGVHQAIAYLYLNSRPSFAPFLIGQNKLYFTALSYHEKYLRAAQRIIAEMSETNSIREIRLYGHKALSWRTSEDLRAFTENL